MCLVRKASELPAPTRGDVLAQLVCCELLAATEDRSGDYGKSQAFAATIELLCEGIASCPPDSIAPKDKWAEFLNRANSLNLAWLSVLLEETRLRYADRHEPNGVTQFEQRATLLTCEALEDTIYPPDGGRDCVETAAVLQYLGRDVVRLQAWACERSGDKRLPTEHRVAAAIVVLSAMHAVDRGEAGLTKSDEQTMERIWTCLAGDFESIRTTDRGMAASLFFVVCQQAGEGSPWRQRAEELRTRAAPDIDDLAKKLQPATRTAGQVASDRHEAWATAMASLAHQEAPFGPADCDLLFTVLLGDSLPLSIDAANLLSSTSRRKTPPNAYLGRARRCVVQAMAKHPGEQWLFDCLTDFIRTLPNEDIDKVLHELLKSGLPEDVVNASCLIRVAGDKRRLRVLEPWLADSNSWVRRNAEDAFEQFGYTTWGRQAFRKSK